MSSNANCELYHYGILGQRWGVRRTQAQLDRNNQKKKTSEDSVKNKEKSNSSDSITKMSNDELNAIVRRLELEKRYRDLNPKTVSAGKKFVDAIIKKTVLPAATDASKQILKDYLIKKGNEALSIKSNTKNK